MSRPLPTEAAVHLAVRHALALFDYRWYNLSQGYRPGGKRHGSTRQTPGLPDLYAQHPAWGPLWLEVKRPGGKLAPAQEAFQRDEVAAGGFAVTVFSERDALRLLAWIGIQPWPANGPVRVPGLHRASRRQVELAHDLYAEAATWS